MSTIHSGMLRDDILMTRTSLSGTSVGLGEADSDQHYCTHNMSAFSQRSGCPAGLKKHGPTHKNFSSLPGFGAPPNGAEYFSTTTGSSFQHNGEQPAGTPRYNSNVRHKTDIFGVMGQTHKKEPFVSTATTMGQSTAGIARHPQPRYVHGGGYRNTSAVALDRNLISAGSPPPQLQSVSHAMQMQHWNQDTIPRPVHRFDLPQKNISTSMSVEAPPADQPCTHASLIESMSTHATSPVVELLPRRLLSR